MGTARRTWQLCEGRVAALFGVRRQPGSGSSGREDQTASDSTHPRLHIETKLRERHTTRTLHDTTKAKARKEGKTPVLALADKNRPGVLICVHSDDLDRLVVEYAAQHASRLWPEIVTAIRANDGIVDPSEIVLPDRDPAA